jgi:hypothetical protein
MSGVVNVTLARLLPTVSRKSAITQLCEGADVAMSSSQPPAGGPAGRLPGDALGDPVVLPVEPNDSSSDLGGGGDGLEHNMDAEQRNQNKAQQIRGQAAEKAAHLRKQAAEKAPQVRAQAAEKAQQIRVRAAEKAPQMVRANRGKAVGAFAFVLLVLWLRRRRSQRSSGAGEVGAVALGQKARSVVGDTANALSAETAATGRAREKAQEVHGRVARAQQVRAQAAAMAQQARAQAAGKAQHLREQAAEKAQAAGKAQQLVQEAQQLVQTLERRLPRR